MTEDEQQENKKNAARCVGMADERAYFAEGSADENIATSLKCAVAAATRQHATRHTHGTHTTHTRHTHTHTHTHMRTYTCYT